MKIFLTLILLALFLWCPQLSAKYCNVSNEGASTSCIYTTKRTPKNSQVVISYTKQGFSMMVAVFMDEFAMVEGDAKARTKKGELHELKYITIRRDMMHTGRVMEAPVYLVSEGFLHELSNAKGKVRFWLSALESKDVEVEVAAGLFSGIDDYIAETKSLLGDAFISE
jgi:hypothetical protein